MGRVREIPRAAAFAWSPGAAPPWIATGTRAGAIDADFSNETQLELWDLGLDNIDQGSELQPSGSISTDSRLVSELPLIYRRTGSRISKNFIGFMGWPGVKQTMIIQME